MGILRKTHLRNFQSSVSSLKSTMASRQALVKGIEWAKIFEKTGPEYRQMINSFKSKSDAIFSSYVKAQGTKLDIDWAHYHNNVNNKELVADFESKFNSLEIPRPVDTKSEGLSAKLAADKVKQEELNPLTSAGWSPTVDGCDIQAPPSLLFEENRTADVPFLAGFNTDEANVFVYPGFPSGMPASVPPLLLGAVFSKDEAYAMSPTQIGELLQAYSNYSDPLAQTSEIVSDGTFICGSVNTAIQQSRRAPTWLYRFNFRSSCPPTRPDTPGVY